MSPRARRAASWYLLALVAVVTTVLVWAVQSGSCADGSNCRSAPALGTAGAWVVTVGAVLVASAALRRGVRSAQALREPVDG